MNAEEKCYSMPDKYIVVPRDGWYIFFDPVHFSFTRVNEHGKAILESIENETPAGEIARTVASKHGLEAAAIRDRVLTFLDDMTATKFLHEGPYAPDEEEPPDAGSGKPGSIYLHPTFKCNQQCIYCYNEKDRREFPTDELTTKEWFGVLDQARDFGIGNIVFTGGEPLLRKDIFELARYAKSVGMACQLLTNGRLVGENNIDDIIESFQTVGFSLDSHIEERNDFLRSPGSFKATIGAMRLLKKHGHGFNAKAVITKHNVWDLPDLLQFYLDEFDMSNLIPNLYIPPSRELTDLLPPLEDYMEAMARGNEVVERYYGDDKVSVLRFHGIPNRQYHCGAAAGEISLAPDGSVFPCQALMKSEFNAGSVRERSLRDIYYDSPVLQKVRSCTVDRIETCRDCDVKNVCGGGCRSLAYNLYGEIDCYNEYSCEYLKTMAYGILWNSTCIPIEQLGELQEQAKTGTVTIRKP